jgi:hypothetical protein
MGIRSEAFSYGRGASGIFATPLFGRGASGIFATPLFGRGASGMLATPLFGRGASGIFATPLAYEIAMLVATINASVTSSERKRFVVVDMMYLPKLVI